MDKDLTMENATEQLESAIQKLETQAMPFRESVELYVEACELLKFCYTELIECKGKITGLNEMLDRLAVSAEATAFDSSMFEEDEDE